MNCLLNSSSLPRKPTGQLSIHASPVHSASSLTAHELSRVVGFVPQDDVMLSELTVRENVLYSARTRLPRSWSAKEVVAFVDACLECLELDGIAHNVVGGIDAGNSKRGVSGGERKRTNIALEVVSAPVLLYLSGMYWQKLILYSWPCF